MRKRVAGLPAQEGPPGFPAESTPLGPAQARVVAAAEAVLADLQRLLRQRKESPEERLHQARVTIKRLRSYWRLASPHIPRDADAEQQRLRAVAHSLGIFRDADVAVALAAEVLPKFRSAAVRAAVRGWVARRQALCGAPRSRARALGSAVRQLQEVPQRLAEPPAPGGGWDWLEPGLRHVYQVARERWRHCRAGGGDAAFHAWRRRIKDLQYFMELLRPVAPHPLGRRLKRLRRVADALGDAHDLALLRDGLAGRDAGGRASGPVPGSARAIEGQAALVRRLEHRIAAGYRAALHEARPLFVRAPGPWLADLRAAWERRHAAQARRRPPDAAD